jgi:prepilin-type N-terminal cleavage/methylation domain-containing protein
MNKGFTLIELLVVVHIIGVLSSVALPQYQKAVKRARGVEARVALKTWADAVHMYYLEYDKYPLIYDSMHLEEVTSILGIKVSPLKYFDLGCGGNDTQPLYCGEGGTGCLIRIRPKSTGSEQSILCSVRNGESIDFDKCDSTAGYTTAQDYGIKK